MKKLITFLFLIVSFTIILFSCKKNKDSKLNETIYLRRNGADMPAYIHGNSSEKVFVVVLHGGPGGNGLEYRTGSFSEEMEKNYVMVYFDQRGQGMSQGRYSDDEISIDEMVKDVRALALMLKNKYGQDSKLFLFGHSWGGTLGSATMVTADYQHLFNGWIEVDGAHDLILLYTSAIKMFKRVGNEQIQLGNNTSYWQGVLTEVNKLDTNVVDHSYLNQEGFKAEEKLAEDGFITKGSPSKGSLTNSVVINNPITSKVSGNFTSAELEKKGMEMFSVSDKLHLITIPTLLLWGSYDFVVPPELGHDALSKISSTNKKLVLFETSGHSPMDNEAEKFTNEVKAFIELNK